MQKSKYSAQEIDEINADKAKTMRKGGLKLMSVRDRGWARLHNGVVVRWHSDAFDNGVPPGKFLIVTPKQTLFFDAEDLRKFLRWA